MPDKKLDKIKKRIEALDAMPMQQLGEKFEDLFGFACGLTSPRNLRLRLAYRMQEILLGGLCQADCDILDAIADRDPLANLQKASAKKLTRTAGARYIREWRGNTYEVIVLGNGKFEFNGVAFKSLSAVAEKITGTHWNGKVFFGVK